MKVLVVGGMGTLGSAIVEDLSKRHEVIIAGRSSGALKVDLEDVQSIVGMFKKVDPLDAVICAAGNVEFGPLAKMTAKRFEVGLKSKLMGQVNLVLLGLESVRDGGSFTLTSGCINYDPIVAGTSAGMVDGAIDGFVVNAALELPRGIRINAVSPNLLQESEAEYGNAFPGYPTVPAAIAARAFRKSVEGKQTGQIYRV